MKMNSRQKFEPAWQVQHNERPKPLSKKFDNEILQLQFHTLR